MTQKTQILDFLANNPGMHETSKIAEAIGTSVKSASPVLSELAREDRITKIQRGLYRGNDEGVSASAPVQFADQRNQMSKHLRTAADNEIATSQLLNDYDELCQEWRDDTDIDFEKRLERFKVLTLIGDKLMKRWSLVHVGYDTNTRQAQEDAKAKTEERQKQELAEAPLEDKIVVVGHYHPDMQEVLRNLPKKELDESEV